MARMTWLLVYFWRDTVLGNVLIHTFILVSFFQKKCASFLWLSHNTTICLYRSADTTAKNYQHKPLFKFVIMIYLFFYSVLIWMQFRPSYQCPSMYCETPMVHHIRRFVHGSGCVQIVLKELDSPVPGYQHTILNYSWCRICKQVTGAFELQK